MESDRGEGSGGVESDRGEGGSRGVESDEGRGWRVIEGRGK